MGDQADQRSHSRSNQRILLLHARSFGLLKDARRFKSYATKSNRNWHFNRNNKTKYESTHTMLQLWSFLRRTSRPSRPAQRFKISDLLIIHRIGTLQIGEVAVFILVASAHRDAAFKACRFSIDRIKQIVPIWKKEFGEDGAVWIEDSPVDVNENKSP